MLDDVGFDGDAEVVRLSGQVGGNVIILLFRLERFVAGVAPQHRVQSQFVGAAKRFADFDDLAARFLRTEIDRRADAGCAHIKRLLDLTEHNLVEGVRVRHEFVVIEFDDERNLVHVFARGCAQYAEG